MQELMLLPQEAQIRLERVAAENQKLVATCEAQGVILSEIAESLPDPEELVKKIDEINEEIKATDEALTNAQTALLNLLTKTEEEPQGAPAGGILRAILKQTMKSLQEGCLNFAKQGNPSVSLIFLIDIESQIHKLIEDLAARGMFPESDEDAQERVLATQAHTLKIIEFLKVLKGEETQ